MRNLLYKEFKLQFNPIYCLVLIFPFGMIGARDYPFYICFISFGAVFVAMFYGLKNGVYTNDFLYTALLPVSKRDMVLSKMVLIAILHFVFIIMMIPVFFFGRALGGLQSIVLFKQMVTVMFLAIISFSIFDFVFYCLYYKSAKEAVAPAVLGMIAQFVALKLLFEILPKHFESFRKFCFSCGVFQTLVLGGVSIMIYYLLHRQALIISEKELEKLNF